MKGNSQQIEGNPLQEINGVDFPPRRWDACDTNEEIKETSTHRASQDSHYSKASGANGINTFKDYERPQLRDIHNKQKFFGAIRPESGTSSVRRKPSISSRRVIQGKMRSYETSRRPQPKLASPTCPALVCWECMGVRIGRQAITGVTGAYRHLRFVTGTGLLYGESRALGK